ILGATAVELKDAVCSQTTIAGFSLNLPLQALSGLVVGLISAFICGLVALHIVSKFVRKAKLHWFSYYCWVVGIISLVLLTR
ncbi:MAG: undecaprenyl-diphosphate phosphatase, partial [Elusimicrobiota bacterium]|nr:undecaprenyl-diphosphate phosphatase [Elusimicrobiota bacterium]